MKKLLTTIVLFTIAGAITAQAAFTNSTLKGKFVFSLQATPGFVSATTSGGEEGVRQTILRNGVFTADGNGNIIGRCTATTDDGLVTVVIDYQWTGKYELRNDGTGEISIEAPKSTDIISCFRWESNGSRTPVTGGETLLNAEVFSVVVTKRRIMRINQIDNFKGAAKYFLTGTAEKQ